MSAAVSPARLSTPSTAVGIVNKLVRVLGRKQPSPRGHICVDTQPFRRVCEKRLPWNEDIFVIEILWGVTVKGVNCIKEKYDKLKYHLFLARQLSDLVAEDCNPTVLQML